MKEIRISVRNKIAMNLNNDTYVCDNSDYRVVFDFDAEWEKHPVKTARFKYNGMYQEVVFTGSVCDMPVIRDARLISIGVYAGNLQTSTPSVVHASQSILSGDAVHDEPAEDVYNQLVELVEAGAVQGETGPAGSDAEVTAENIGKALGFTPADEETVNQLKNKLSDNAEADAETRRKLHYLWKLNQGISYQFETDDAEAYQKNVPSGAKLASVQENGGKTLVWNQLLSPQNYTKREYHEINSDGSVTFLGITQNGKTRIFENITYLSNHKYLISYDGQNSSVKFKGYFGSYITSENGKSSVIVSATVDGADGNFGLGIINGEISGTYRFLLVDLTLMLGSGNEPTSTDDPRIAWIEEHAADHPEYNDGELVSADVDSVKYNDAVVYEIPEAVRNLPGYGWSAGDAYNSIERTETGWQYVQRVGSVDLGELNWKQYGSSGKTYQTEIKDKRITFENNVLSNRLTYAAFGWENPIKYMVAPHNTLNNIYCCLDWTQTNESEFKAGMSGVMLYYELAEPIVTDISDLMDSTLDAITVETGGTLTFENAAKLPVPSTEKYLIALAEVNQ